MTWCITYWKVYLEGRHFTLYTDHTVLHWLLDQKETANGRMAKWCLLLQGYDFTIHHLAGKLNVVADALSRREYDMARTEEDDIIDSFPSDPHLDSLTKVNALQNTSQELGMDGLESLRDATHHIFACQKRQLVKTLAVVAGRSDYSPPR